MTIARPSSKMIRRRLFRDGCAVLGSLTQKLQSEIGGVKTTRPKNEWTGELYRGLVEAGRTDLADRVIDELVAAGQVGEESVQNSYSEVDHEIDPNGRIIDKYTRSPVTSIRVTWTPQCRRQRIHSLYRNDPSTFWLVRDGKVYLSNGEIEYPLLWIDVGSVHMWGGNFVEDIFLTYA